MIPTPDFPQFYYIFGGNLGSLLYGDVPLMFQKVRKGSIKNVSEVLVKQNCFIITCNRLILKSKPENSNNNVCVANINMKLVFKNKISHGNARFT